MPRSLQLYQCRHFNECSGCTEPLSDTPPSIWQEVKEFFSDKELTYYPGSCRSWRHRAKLAIRGTSDVPLLGLFKKGTHDVIPIPACLVHHPKLTEAFAIIDGWMRQNAIHPYNEKLGTGELRYIQGVVERSTQHVQLTFVLNFQEEDSKAIKWQHLIRKLGNAHPTLWHSLWLNFNQKATNSIFGSDWMQIYGKELLWERFGEIEVCYGPASFGQANLPLFEKMLFQIAKLIPQQARVVEFYAGVGAIGLFLAGKCCSIICCEVNPFAEYFFNQSRIKLSPEKAQRINFFTAASEKSWYLLKDANCVIVDPPRKGLDASFFSALKQSIHIEQLIYISCGWASFKRDCSELLSDGWKIDKVEGYQFFPGSHHIEILANFVRLSS